MVLGYRKRHFRGLYFLKKKVGKMAIFGQKPWINPFGKMSSFRLFKLRVFFGLEKRFFVLEYSKRHFPGVYCLKKKSWKMANFKPKPWVNPFGKCQFFDFLKLLFLKARKVWFRSKIS